MHQVQIQIHDPIPPPYNNGPDEDGDRDVESLKSSLLRHAETTHGRLPGIRKIPLPAIGIIVLVAVVNMVVWVVVGIVLVCSVLSISNFFLSIAYDKMLID